MYFSLSRSHRYTIYHCAFPDYMMHYVSRYASLCIGCAFGIQSLRYTRLVISRDSRLYKRVCLSVRPSVRPSVGPLVRPSVRNAFFLIGQKWVETNKNEISDDEAGRDYTSHDLFRV